MPSPVDDYIDNQPEALQPILCQVRDVIREALPTAEERISWQMPTWWEGRNIIHFAAQKRHLGVYPGPEVIEHFAPIFDEAKYKHSRGAVQFSYAAVPFDLIRQIAEHAGQVNVAQ